MREISDKLRNNAKVAVGKQEKSSGDFVKDSRTMCERIVCACGFVGTYMRTRRRGVVGVCSPVS